MNDRKCCRSAKVWNSRLDPPCAALAAALKTGPPNRASVSTATRIRMMRRIMSIRTCAAIAMTTIMVNIISVSVLRLVSTRSDMLNR
jgi:hypothetical protein